MKHGTYSGYQHHGCRCPACKDAHYRYVKARRCGRHKPRHIDATGTRRRIHALYRMGYPTLYLARLLGHTTGAAISAYTTKRTVHIDTAASIARLYEQLAMTPGPSEKAREMAIARGFAGPLAWDDIDDPGEVPRGVEGPRPTGDKTGRRKRSESEPHGAAGELDEVLLWRLDHEPGRLSFTRAQRALAVEYLAGQGWSDAATAQRLHVVVRTVQRDRQQRGIASQWAPSGIAS